MSKRIFIYGASGHGKVVQDMANDLGILVLAFVDDNEALQSFCDLPVFSNVPIDVNLCVIAIGNNQVRKKLAKSNPDKEYMTLIHPKSTVSKKAHVGSGTVVMAGVTINADAQIGDQCIVNTNSSLDHDCVLGNFVHVSPNAALSGGVNVGEGTHIGIGACVIPGITIGKWVTIGAGAVVINPVPDYAVVVGNPGSVIKFNNYE